MKVYDENKIKELTEYDLSKGYLKDDTLSVFVETVRGKTLNQVILEYRNKGYAIEYIGGIPYAIIKKYANGGKTVEQIKEIADIPAHYKEEKISVYVPYTEKELAIIEINQLKQKLNSTDYQAIKFAEGLISEIDYATIKSERQSWRDRINQLEKLWGISNV